MATIKADRVVEQYLEVIPGAASMAEKYLQAVVSAVRDQQLDVTLGTVKVEASGSASFFRQLQRREFVVIEPRNANLDEFRFYHFAAPAGVNLAVGWYLTRDPKNLNAARVTSMAIAAATRSTAISTPYLEKVLSLDLFDQADLQALLQCVHSFVVLQAVYQIADGVGYPRDQLGARSKGFFGIGAT